MLYNGKEIKVTMTPSGNVRMTKEIKEIVNAHMSKLGCVDTRHALRTKLLRIIELDNILDNAQSERNQLVNEIVPELLSVGIQFPHENSNSRYTVNTVQQSGAPVRYVVVETPETVRVNWGDWAKEVHGVTAEQVKALGYVSTVSAQVKVEPIGKTHLDSLMKWTAKQLFGNK